MELSPTRQLKNLTIEARHTLSLQESKKKRLQFEKSLFLPNNKKRKDVLKCFDRKSPTLNTTIEPSPKPKPNTGNLNPENLTYKPTEIPFSYDFDSSSEGSDYSDGNLSMKRNRPSRKEVANKEPATSENDGPTDDVMVFPSYVIYRTKGTKIKLVQDKTGKKNPSPTSTSEEESQELVASKPEENQETKEPISIDENPESATEPNVIENPTIPSIDSEELNAQVAANTLIDLSQKSQPNEESPALPAANGNTSPLLPSTSSNSMEFLIQSSASNESTAFSSDCLDKSDVDPPSVRVIQKTTDSSKTGCLKKASTPKPICDVIVGNEILHMRFLNTSQLIQDTEVQSSTITTRSGKVLVPTSNAHDTEIQTVQTIPNNEFNLLRTSKHDSNNSESPTEEVVVVPTPSSPSQELTWASKLGNLPSFKRYFEALTHQRQIASEEIIASPSPDIENTEEQLMQSERESPLMKTLKAQCNMSGQVVSIPDCTEPEILSVQKAFTGGPNFEFNAPHYALRYETANQRVATQQAETTPKASTDTMDQLTKLPNSNRYFKPFYLQRPPVFGVESTPSTSKSAKPSADQQPVASSTNLRRTRQAQKPSTNTQEKTKLSAHNCATKKDLEAYAKTIQYQFPPAYNNPICSTQQIFSHQCPAFAPEPKQMNYPLQQTNKPYTRTSSTIENTPIEIPRPEMFQRPQPPAPALSSASAPASAPALAPTQSPAQSPTQSPAQSPAHAHAHAPAQTPPQAPAFNNNPYYNQHYHPQLSSNQHSFPPFPVGQQQPNMHSYNVPSHISSPKQSPRQHPPNPKQNIYGYQPRNDLGCPHPSYNYQPPFQIPQNSQHPSPNQTGPQTENNQGPYNARNYAPPPPPVPVSNEVMSYNSGHQYSYWYQHQHQQKSPPAEPPISRPQPPMPIDQSASTVDPNKWLNARFQQAIKHPEKTDKSTWVARPIQDPARLPPSSPMDVDTWMRARIQQAAKPPTIQQTTEQRLCQLEAVVNSFNVFVHKFEGFKKTLKVAVALRSPPSPPSPVMALPSTSQPWQTQPMVSNSNSPTVTALGTPTVPQPGPDPRSTWEEYYNLMNTKQMQGNTGYQRNSTAPENHARMDANPVPQYPVSQQIMSHQINAADSTTGGNPTSSIDYRSFRPSQNYNQPNSTQLNQPNQPFPQYNTYESWKNQFHYFK